jgi:hypothetical protein
MQRQGRAQEQTRNVTVRVNGPTTSRPSMTQVSRCRHTIVGSEPVLQNEMHHSVPLPFGLERMVDLPPTNHHPVRRHDNYWLFDTPLPIILATLLTFVACCVEKELGATAPPILRCPPRATCTSEMILGY